MSEKRFTKDNSVNIPISSFRKVKIVANSGILCSLHHVNRQHLVLFDPSSTKTNILTAM